LKLDKLFFWFAALAVFKVKPLLLKELYLGNLLNKEFDIGGTYKLLIKGFWGVLLDWNSWALFGGLVFTKGEVYTV
jgi:hypothetical protein